VRATSTQLCPACLLDTALDPDAQDDAGTDSDDAPPYDIETILGRDAEAVTYLARGFLSREPVALKIIDMPDVAEFVSRVHAWKTRVAGVRHPAVSRMIDAGISGQRRVYLATEYIAGPSLDYLLSHRPPHEADRREIARQLAGALEAIHAKGLAHMRLDARHVRVAAGATVRATILGLGTSLIVSGWPPQPALDIAALTGLCRELNVPLP